MNEILGHLPYTVIGRSQEPYDGTWLELTAEHHLKLSRLLGAFHVDHFKKLCLLTCMYWTEQTAVELHLHFFFSTVWICRNVPLRMSWVNLDKSADDISSDYFFREKCMIWCYPNVSKQYHSNHLMRWFKWNGRPIYKGKIKKKG